MMAEHRDMAFFRCPTSGQMLGMVVRAFRLNLSEVGGPAAERIGNGDAGKSARNYFAGNWVVDDTRRDICRQIAQALVHSGMVPYFVRPVHPSSGKPPDAAGTEQLIRMALFTWVQIWDEAYQIPASRWHRAHSELAGFVLGRQLVVDLSLRLAALLHFVGVANGECLSIEDGRGGKGAPIINGALKRAGISATREELARMLRHATGHDFNDRTIDRWFDELIIPDDSSLSALAKALADLPEHRVALLRWLRIQYGCIRLAEALRSAVGADFAITLIDALWRFTNWNRRFSALSLASVWRGPGKAELFDGLMTNLLFMGSGERGAAMLIDRLLAKEQDWWWHDDLQFAGNGAVPERLAACLQVIGDWPMVETELKRHLPSSVAAADRARLAEFAALSAMNDLRMSGGPPGRATGDTSEFVRVTGDNAFKARNRAAQAKAAMDRGDFDGSLEHWERAIALTEDPHTKARYLFFYGGCLWQGTSRRFDDAIGALREACRLQPKWGKPFNEIAIVYQHRGWFENVLEHLDTDPSGFATSSAQFNEVKGATLRMLHRHADALACLDRAIKLGSTDPALIHVFAADCAFELAKSSGDQAMRRRGRDHAKRALHLGDSRACDKWDVK